MERYQRASKSVNNCFSVGGRRPGKRIHRRIDEHLVPRRDGVRREPNAQGGRYEEKNPVRFERTYRRRYTPTTLPRSMVERKSEARTRMGAICELAGWKRT